MGSDAFTRDFYQSNYSMVYKWLNGLMFILFRTGFMNIAYQGFVMNTNGFTLNFDKLMD